MRKGSMAGPARMAALVLLALAAAPGAACSCEEADVEWTLPGPGGDYGLVQYDGRVTDICLGPTGFSIPLSAYATVGFAFLGVLLVPCLYRGISLLAART